MCCDICSLSCDGEVARNPRIALKDCVWHKRHALSNLPRADDHDRSE